MADDVTQTPFAGPDPAGGQSLIGQWNQALQDPTARAALLSFGLQMLQPPSPGQNALGVLGTAIGAAGETVTKRAKIDQEEEESAAKLSNAEAALGFNERRVQASERNAATREKALQLRAQPGAISAKDFMRQQAQTRRELQNIAAKQAKAYAEALQKAQYGDPDALPADVKRWAGKSEPEIYQELLRDPEWQRKNVAAIQQATSATVPPATERQVGQVYQTPKGPMEWAGNGWRPAKVAPAPSRLAADDDEDE